MNDWKPYLHSILACCLISAIVLQLVSDTGAKGLVRFVCAMLTAISIGTPLAGMDWSGLLQWPQPGSGADAYIRQGEETARDAKAACIQAVCRTYILEKAKALDGEILEVTITLNDDLLPAYAEIHGRMDQKVQEILTTDLGIPKEQQTWIWNQESSSSSS